MSRSSLQNRPIRGIAPSAYALISKVLLCGGAPETRTKHNYANMETIWHHRM
ncbi:hypothetical protein COLSTE_00127 [Collinsella stercoris DSM 13279]|uniref:Uncharacterized protein n=1 Tax=Collinsella stercoris DSM 13279 TaxID=445975 RepID=B6G7T7_9ACTN|nr:hypothetical protein COLSTE_00127 [Collinsella stercoris DSM 13279]